MFCLFNLPLCLYLWQNQANLERLDGYYGECDNPQRVMSVENIKSALLKKEQGKSLFDLTADFDKLLGRDSNEVVYQSNVNPHYGRASLEVTKKYPLKIADNQGGFIETDWIYDVNNNQQRCLIKIQVLSSDLTTTGVTTNFICETKNNVNWVPDNKDYIKSQIKLH